MRRSVPLLLILLMSLQLCLPVQAAELESTVDASVPSVEDDAQTSNLTEEETEEGVSPSEPSQDQDGDGEPASEEEQEPESPGPEETQEPSKVPAEEEEEETQPEPEQPSEAQEAGSPTEASPEQPEEALPEEEERLYNGEKADYEDPQFLKLLADGFFDNAGIAPMAEIEVSHNSRFQGFNIQKGIDISKWNDISSWSKIAQEVEFVFIRCGNRTTSGGNLSKDYKFDTNMENALAAGLDVGVYIYSQAITVEEAREEANFALELCEGYSFQLPIVIDYEYYGTDGRLYNAHLSNEERTSICRAFCEVIEDAGYPAMIYANKDMLLNDMDGESLAEAGYDIWMAHWVSATNYPDTYTYWQYTDSDIVAGINGKVDANYRYELPEAQLSDAYSTLSGVQLSWNKVSLADRYRIYRKLDGTSKWTEIASVSSNVTTYLDEDAVVGNTYRYAVQACRDQVRALYDRTGWKVTHNPEIYLTSAQTKTDGVQLSWKALKEFEGYRIYRCSGINGIWSRIADISDPDQTSYLDTKILSTAEAGQVYSYTIRGVNSDGSLSNFDRTGLAVTILETPTLASATALDDGVRITWKQVPDATKYGVYRRENNAWTPIATLTGPNTTSYTDTAATSDSTVYTYTVRAFGAVGRSGYSQTGISTMQVEVPQLLSAVTTDDGVKLTWQARSNVKNYRVYRKTGSGIWVALATLGNVSSYVDKTAEHGVQYSYTVRSYVSGYWSWYHEKGLTLVYLATPAPAKPERVANGVKISWPAVTGAAKYRVYRKTTGSWEPLAIVTTTSYVDSSQLQSNTNYFYTVRAFDSASNSSRYLSDGVSYYHLDSPTLKSTVCKAEGVQVSWGQVSGAEKYVVYRKIGTSAWSRIAVVGKVSSYLDTTAVSGTTYLYTVRAYCQGSYSWFETDGISCLFLGTPKLVSAAAVSTGLQLKWEAVSGAQTYAIYRKTPGTQWSARIATVTGTSYIDRSLTSGTPYIYTVRAFSGSNMGYYDTVGLTFQYLSIPAGLTAVSGTTGVQVKWNTVPGADKYYVYRMDDAGKWVRIDVITRTSYTDSDVRSGKTYTYTVRAGVGSYASWYDGDGVSCLYR